MNVTLDALRREIDRIDAELVTLLHRRLCFALAAGFVKRSTGLPSRDDAREADLLRRAAWGGQKVVELYRGVIDGCRTFAEASLSRTDDGRRPPNPG